ncbi:hypothetical protein Tco_0574886, partial [Tanacetum coccineum]
VVRVSRSMETPVKRKMILSKEDDRKKKLKGKAGLKRKRSGLDCSDSSSIDTENIKRLISKLEKKVKK